ncbi:Scr1 family TA system antitoxin-like transcriptional regulator [Streptomyces sp. TRM 70361]|uniref:Scr1 family TA system antitoxin-like transcriptional regulator n=1 Tax=Streptomyces sp. TRM 70361 TaxID=3116553 RepID=UPI003FCE5F1B
MISDVVPSLAPHDVEHRVSYRIKRQATPYGDEPTPLTAVVHEAALRMGFGGPAVSRAQLAKYRTVTDRMEGCALTPAKSRELMHRIAQDL